MRDTPRRQAPTREATLDALHAAPWDVFHGTVSGIRAREADFLVLVRHSRIEEEVAVAYLWPNAALTGDSTGEAQPSLADWVVEIALDLDEFFGTEPVARMLVQPDAESGYRIVRRYGPRA